MGKPSRSELICELLATPGQILGRDLLDTLDETQLLRLHLATFRQRLNPARSTNFLEEGIPLAEAEARAKLFVERCTRTELEKFAVTLVMNTFVADAMVESQRGLTDAYRDLPEAVFAAWGNERAAQQEKKRLTGKSGGDKAAAKVEAVRNRAIKLALERRPVAGWASAPAAAEAIYSDVRDYARTLGRNFSRRAVEEWMRAAGIKRGA